MANLDPNFTINLRDIFKYKFMDNTIPETLEVIKVDTAKEPPLITLKNIATGKVVLHSPEEVQIYYIKQNRRISS